MDFRLHPKQSIAFKSKATEILFGGAAGSAKSHLMRVLAIAMCVSVPGLQVYLFRREYPELKRNHFEGPSSFLAMLAEWISSGSVKFNISEMTLTFPNGSQIHACHCQHENDVYGYQGAEIHVLLIDELTHFTDFQYRYLRGRCRIGSLHVPEDCPWSFPRIFSGSNPGGAGHNWVKAAFIDSANPMDIHTASDEEGGMQRQFIPAKLTDNPSIDAVSYTKSLQGLGNPTLVKAMLDGDWNIVAGGMFDDVWLPGVVRAPFPIPPSWRLSRSFDWGSSHPFAVCWWAEADGTGTKDAPALPKGSWVMIGEWYGWNGKPDEGCRMMAAEIARGVLEREKQMGIAGRVTPGPADSAIYATENGNCIADDMERCGVRWTRADKGPGSRINGWQQMRQLMSAAAKTPMEEPGLIIFDTCRHALRTIPVAPRDPRKQDDVDTASEDHLLDAIRYRCSMPTRVAGSVALPGVR